MIVLTAADDVQLQILMSVFERTPYPSTEEREALARKLGMTSRSVQIWVSLNLDDRPGLDLSVVTSPSIWGLRDRSWLYHSDRLTNLKES